MAQGDLTKLESRLHTAVISPHRRSRPDRYGRTEWPCAHVMLSMREVLPGREGHEERDKAGFGKKVVAWNSTELLRDWRERWASLANERLLERGLDVRIDHRSYAEQGIELEPQHKIGPAGMRREDRGGDAERAAEHVEIARRNGEKIIERPEVVLDAITRQHSTFSRQDMARFVSRHTADKEQFDLALAKVEAAPELVRLGMDGRDMLTSRDVLVIDEAGLVGSRQMERVLSHAQAAGAKVVLVGDPEQLQAIDAGAAFRALAERHGAAEISEVRRQREDWQRAATRELATEHTAQALERYAEAGMVYAVETREDAKAALVRGWDAVRRESPATSQMILAYTRDDVRDLNVLACAELRGAGELRGADQVVRTERGERAFAAGDRIMFGRNERGLGGDGRGRAA